MEAHVLFAESKPVMCQLPLYLVCRISGILLSFVYSGDQDKYEGESSWYRIRRGQLMNAPPPLSPCHSFKIHMLSLLMHSNTNSFYLILRWSAWSVCFFPFFYLWFCFVPTDGSSYDILKSLLSKDTHVHKRSYLKWYRCSNGFPQQNLMVRNSSVWLNFIVGWLR